MLADVASKNIVICSEELLRGHIKGKWIEKENIIKHAR